MTLTASALDRAKECIASVVLPQEDTSSPNAARGTAVARYLQRVAEAGAEVALAEVPTEYVEVCASIDLERLPHLHLAAEVAWAYHPASQNALELGRGLGRDYEAALQKLRPGANPDEWIFGTADVLGVGEESVFIGDHKGFQSVERPDKNLQIGAAAVAFAIIYGKREATVAILRPLEGSGRHEYARLSGFDLDLIGDTLADLKEAEAAARIKTPEPVPGKHCEYCKAARHCPAATSLLKANEALVHSPAKNSWQALITRDNAGDFWARALAAEALAKQIKGIVGTMASVAPIPLPNGRTLGLIEGEGNERLEPVKTYEVLVETVGERTANDCMERVATKAGIARGLKAHGAGKLEKQIYAEIRRRGGARRAVTKKVGEY